MDADKVDKDIEEAMKEALMGAILEEIAKDLAPALWRLKLEYLSEKRHGMN